MAPDSAQPAFEALTIPAAVRDEGGVEVMRAAVVSGELHISVRRVFDDPDTWGTLLGDAARRLAKFYADDTGMSEADALRRVCAAFEIETANPSDSAEPGAFS
jgi:hypothetical protein